ncbi:Short-chain dehydrogenase [Madurella fahalii]|uniref:Short-chain dehydrogenase n=1 Tax=Madurella fahalii TaxID=1157608 RepID=A0ABQ0GC97_9PEZI
MRNFVAAVALAGAVTAYTDIRHKRYMIKNIDPIVLPGQYKSHMHSFFGSDAVTKDLPTTKDLQQGCASGENPNDLSVYWIPTLYYVRGPNDYVEVNPGMFSTYYENIDKAEIPYPQDFFAVAGNASAKSQNDVDERTTGITWWCENGPEDRQNRNRALMPQVTCSGNIQVILRFPDCVNTADIKDYTYAAANGGRCPSNMKRIPQLRFSVRYNVRSLIPQGWRGTPPLKLACGEVGEGYCFHGDFINGWFDDAQQNLLKATSRNTWMRIDGARGQGKAGSQCTPKDAEPENGTSDYFKSLEMMAH